MKLNSKRTFIIGLAFFSICAFWQMYDNIVPVSYTHLDVYKRQGLPIMVTNPERYFGSDII